MRSILTYMIISLDFIWSASFLSGGSFKIFPFGGPDFWQLEVATRTTFIFMYVSFPYNI